jgi:hypothetical protein
MSRILLDTYGSLIHTAVNDKPRLTKFITHIEKYFDKNHAIVFDQGPTKKLLFANSDKQVVYDFLGMSDKDVADVKKVIKTVPTIYSKGIMLNDPFVILSVYIVRELHVQKLVRQRDLVLMYLAFKNYSSSQNKFFKYGANEQVMAFTLNNLSDKFKYKVLKNNYAVLKDTVMNSHMTYEKLLETGTDDMPPIYYIQLHSRVNKIIRNIAGEYYTNYNEKRYINSVKTYDEESGGLIDYENSSALISGLAEGTLSYFLSSSVNMNLVKTVSERNSIPSSTVFQALNAIKKEEDPLVIQLMITKILTIIYDDNPDLLGRVCSQDFAINAIKQLSISNTTNPNLIELKNILDKWLMTYNIKYAQTQRLATKMAYRNALYSYFVYILILNKCKS